MKLLRKSLNSRLYRDRKLVLIFASLGVVIIAATGYSLSQSNTPKTAAPQPKIIVQPKNSLTDPAPRAEDKKKQPMQPTSPQPQQLPAAVQPKSSYPVHDNIVATVFWVGEGADNSNDYIHNSSSAWATNWIGSYGGIDDPANRCGYRPCAFSPKENPFYFALPFNDHDDNGPKSAAILKKIPWYTGSIPANMSILKNRWIEVTYGQKTAYAQWEDVGPFGEDDIDYVFGVNRPAEQRAGLDMSPALANYLGIDGRALVSWRFIEAAEVPNGEWTKIITTTNLQY